MEQTVDRDGVATSYTYDSAKRLVSSTRLSITQSNVLDAAGRVLVSVRIGTDGSKFTNSVTGYNTAGRVVTSTNAMGGITRYGEELVNGKLVRTTTNPDGGTYIETYYRDGRLEKVSGTAAHPVMNQFELFPETDLAFNQQVSIETKETEYGWTEWVKRYTDHMGRAVKTEYPDGAYSQQFYNSSGNAGNTKPGLLWKTRTPDGVIGLYRYNGLGRAQWSATDLDRDSVIDWAGPDRVSETIADVTLRSGIVVLRTRSYVYVDGSSTPMLISTSERSADGLRSWETTLNLVSQSQTATGAGGYRYVTNTSPDLSYSVSTYLNGRLVSAQELGASGASLGKVTYSYDKHGRQEKVTDARNGSTTFGYNSADMPATVTNAVPGTGAAPQVITTLYDTSLRAWKTVHADGGSVVNEFYPTGLLRKTSGAETYPVEYTYDPQGRLKTMSTWTNIVLTPAVVVTTTWNYHSQRGWLSSKRYANGLGPDYQYTLGGQLKKRIWARGSPRVETIYSYGFDDAVAGNDSADLVGTSYANENGVTQPVTMTYDRRGRLATSAKGGMTTLYGYNDLDQLTTEENVGGALDGLLLDHQYDSLFRRQVLSLTSSPAVSYTFGYDANQASKLTSVTDGTHRAEYAYVPNSPLVSQITFNQGAEVRLVTTRQYDLLNRLLAVYSRTNASASSRIISHYGYQYNDSNQRTRSIAADGSFWVYQYDELGQVVKGRRYWSDGSLIPGQQFEYGFDDIGNRRHTKTGGDQTGGNLRLASYTPNNLNQYTSRTVPNSTDILGIADADSSVTVNSSPADYRKGEYFWESLGLALSATDPLWQSVSVSAGSTPVSGNLLLPPAPQICQYDDDGNLISDGLWLYFYDAENRLYQIENPATLSPTTARKRLKFEHDYRGRRIKKSVFNWATSDYSTTPASETSFVYDGWNLIRETTGASWKSYMWGLDLSGSEQGAGGVGGLLLLNDSSLGASFVCYDGNGNVAKLVKATDSTTLADFEYGPFGEPIRVPTSGTLATGTPFRFSTKYHDHETGLAYYGYRYYSPSTGRWLNRDPIEERGGLNLYGFVGNDGINDWDLLGRIVYVRSHYVLPSPHLFGRYQHLSLKIVPDDQCQWGGKWPFEQKDRAGMWYASYGAGPTSDRLVSGFNRAKDVDVFNGGAVKLKTAVAFIGEVEDENTLIHQLIALEIYYQDNLEYNLKPEKKKSTGWNSNSFIRGVFKALPALTEPGFPNGADHPGWPTPVPRHYFGL